MKKLLSLVLIFTVLIISVPGMALIATAASASALSDTMSNQTISANSSHIIKFTTPTGANANGDTIVITFPSGFNFTSKSISSLTFTHGASTGLENTETLAASPTSSDWGAVFSGTNNVILTLTAPTSGAGAAPVAPNDKVIITYSSANAINPSSAGNYAISVNSNGDTGTITVPILTNSQVAISATVDEGLSFSISNNSIGFGSLSSTATTFATSNSSGSTTEPTDANTISASSNSTSGYTIALSGSTLTSGVNTIAPISGASAQALDPGTQQFGIRADLASGTGGTISAPFNGTAGNYGFGTSPLSSQSFASTNGATGANVYNVNYAANITPLTPAGSYTTTLTYVATANF